MKKYLVLLLLFGCSANMQNTSDNGGKISLRKADLNGDLESVVYFAFDSSALSMQAREKLKTNVMWMGNNKREKVTIEGHCDERGTKEYNLALGERRAYAVKNFLVDNGVSSKRIEVISYGEERPVVSGTSERAYSKNRRGQIVIR